MTKKHHVSQGPAGNDEKPLSKRDIAMFEKMLLERKNQIQKNIQDTAQEMSELSDCELNDEGDYAAASSDNMIDQAISSQQQRELGEIEYALSKIKDSTYGVCEMCEEPVGKERLKVKPHAKYCIVCRELTEKKG